MSQGRRVGAAIDAGSNSVHLVVGIVDADGVHPLVDQSTLLGLGDVVDRLGHLPRDAIAGLVATLGEYIDIARRYEARTVTLLATEPFRRASNRSVAQSDVRSATGLPLHLLNHETEVLLTLLGVTGGRPPAGPLFVVDIGGGSSEMVLAVPGAPPQMAALATGSARLTAAFVEHDPPTWFEVNALRAEAARLVTTMPDGRAERCVMVGGTATNLIRLAPDARERSIVDRPHIATIYDLVTRLPAAEVVERFVVNRRRAGQLAAGAALVEAIMDRAGVDTAEVTQASLRDGAILAADRLGDTWPEHLADLVSGRRRA